MSSQKGHIFSKVRNTNFESKKDASVPRRSKKNSVTGLFWKVIDGSSCVQSQYESTLSLCQKGVEINKESCEQSPDEMETSGKTHYRKFSHSKSVENFNIRKKTVASNLGFKSQLPCGLENLGNTCYLNAILQCLRSTKPVHDFCKIYNGGPSKPSKNHSNLVSAFTYLITKMNSVTNGSVSSNTLHKFKNAFVAQFPNYKGNLQQDALEFFTYLVDGLHEGIKERPQTPGATDLPSTPTSTFTSLSSLQRDYRLKRRRGGLKTSESSGHLTGGDREASCDDSSEFSSRYFKKIARKLSEKVIRPLRFEGSYDVFHDIHQPPVNSADATASENSFLKDTFVGHLQTRLRCLRCNNITTRDELFWNLSLCVPEANAPTEKETRDKRPTANASVPSSVSSVTSEPNSVSLDDCLNTFTKSEILDDVDRPTCGKCKARNKAELQVKISELPKILVLQFQRFESSCCKNKKRNLIKFGFEQDMSPYYVDDSVDVNIDNQRKNSAVLPKCISSPTIFQLSDDSVHRNDAKRNSMAASTHKLSPPEASTSTNYRLYAVVYHQGGTERGHYTARCRLPPNPSDYEQSTWYFFDDENVSKVAANQDVIHPTAYILFYEQIDPKVKSYSSSNTTKPADDMMSSSFEKIPVKFTTIVDED